MISNKRAFAVKTVNKRNISLFITRVRYSTSKTLLIKVKTDKSVIASIRNNITEKTICSQKLLLKHISNISKVIRINIKRVICQEGLNTVDKVLPSSINKKEVINAGILDNFVLESK